ncbi:MAG: VTT domain-containing protein, partial [Terriglobia bacterium]
MNNFLRHCFFILAHFGGFGLLAIGALDSSLLFLPLGNDLLIIAMSTRRHSLVPYYAFMAAAGSVLGCLSVDALSRKGGEKELEAHVSRKRLEYVRSRMRKNASWALAIASLMPPP